MTRAFLPLNYQQSAGTVILPMDSLSGWGNLTAANGGSITLDSSKFPGASGGIKVTIGSSSTGTIAFLTRGVSLDFSAGGSITVPIYVDKPNIFGAFIYFSTQQADANGSKFFKINPTYSRLRRGLNYITYDLSEFTIGGGENVYTAPVIGFQLKITGNGRSGAGESIWFGPITYRARARPKLVMTLDDGLADHFATAYPALAARGLVASSFVISNLIGSASYMTAANLQTLYAAGWDICNHTKTHPYFTGWATSTGYSKAGPSTLSTTQVLNAGQAIALDGPMAGAPFDAPRSVVVRSYGDEQNKGWTIVGTVAGQQVTERLYSLGTGMHVVSQHAFDGPPTSITPDLATAAAGVSIGTTMSQAEIYSEISTCDGLLASLGLTRGRGFLSLPYGYDDLPLLTAAAIQAGIKAIRNPVGDAPYGTPTALGVPDLLQTPTISATTTLAALKGYVDAAILRGSTAIVNIDTLPDSASIYLPWLDYVKALRDAGQIDVVTVSQWYSGLGNPTRKAA